MNSRRLLRQAMIPILASLSAFAGLAAAWAATEDDLKAASVCKVVKFVEWPAAALENQRSFVLCVAEPDILGDALVAFARNRTVLSRSIEVRRMKSGEDMRSCHALFVSARPARKASALVREVHKLPVLTLGDAAEFLDAGGMIAVTVGEGRLRIEINTDSVRSSGLFLDPQLLRIAQGAKGRQP